MSESLITIKFVGPAAPFGDRDAIEAFVDVMMDELLSCDVIDPSIALGFENEGRDVAFEFEFEVEGRFDEIITEAMGSVRAAFHVAGAATPGWEHVIAQMNHDIRATSSTNTNLIDA